jgi:hypothetical protein
MNEIEEIARRLRQLPNAKQVLDTALAEQRRAAQAKIARAQAEARALEDEELARVARETREREERERREQEAATKAHADEKARLLVMVGQRAVELGQALEMLGEHMEERGTDFIQRDVAPAIGLYVAHRLGSSAPHARIVFPTDGYPGTFFNARKHVREIEGLQRTAEDDADDAWRGSVRPDDDFASRPYVRHGVGRSPTWVARSPGTSANVGREVAGYVRRVEDVK